MPNSEARLVSFYRGAVSPDELPQQPASAIGASGNPPARIRACRSLPGKLVAFVAKEVDAGLHGLGVVLGATLRQDFIQRYLNAP